jgi:hypothetical protein
MIDYESIKFDLGVEERPKTHKIPKCQICCARESTFVYHGKSKSGDLEVWLYSCMPCNGIEWLLENGFEICRDAHNDYIYINSEPEFQSHLPTF